VKWLNAPSVIRRFTVHQIVQHWLAVAIGAVLIGTAMLSSVGAAASLPLHRAAAAAAVALFLYHGLSVAAVAIRRDVTWEEVAFIPRFSPLPGGTGKYSGSERGDYGAILLWFSLAAAAGLVLYRPSRFGVSGPGVLRWVRVVHAGLGAAWTVHLLVHHVPGRWLGAAPAWRAAIVRGTVPLAAAEARPGWIAALVREGVLVPAPREEGAGEEAVDAAMVRQALERGNRLVRAGRLEEACAAFEEALRLYPGYSQARFNLAVAMMRLGRPEAASREFRRFLEDDPFNPMAERARHLLEECARQSAGGPAA